MAKIDIPTYNFELYRGDDKELDVQMITNKADKVNLNGFSFSMLIKPKTGESFLLLEGKGLTVLHQEGVVKITLSHELTKNWKFTAAQYDLQGKSQKITKTFMRGLITVVRDITY